MLKDLAHGERAPRPRVLASDGPRHAGAQRSDRAHPISCRREAIGLGEEVGRRTRPE
jgi:hypothetical protein